MSNAFYTGAAGMRAFQSALDVTGHNMANLNTPGYKTRRAAFDDVLRSQINTNVDGQHLVGHGVKQQYIDEIMLTGNLQQTDYELDFAIEGNGFFAVDAAGTRQYTRNGSFDLSVAGDSATLVTNDGAYVLDRAGARITLPVANGRVDTSTVKDRLGVFGFANPWGLTPQNNARYTPSGNSGAAALLAPGNTQAGGYQVQQFMLEQSSVQLASEMVNVINAQRAYQLSARVVQTADNLMEVVTNLR